VYGGGVDGSPDVGHTRLTSDGFASGVAATTATTSGHTVTQVYVDGNIVYRTTADNIDPAAATAGTVEMSTDGGDNFSVVHTATEGLYDILYGEQYYWTFGSDGYVARSQNGTSFTQLTQTALPTTDFMRAAYDPVSSAIYVAGFVAAVGHAAKISNSVVEDISTEVLVGTTKALHDVKVLSTLDDDLGHVAFVGDDGFFSENRDTASGNTYVAAVIPTTADLYAIGGDSFRTFVGGVGGVVFHRAIYTDMVFDDFWEGATSPLTGDVRCCATGLSDFGVNYVAFGTSISGTTGEILVLRQRELAV
jgi:hypothetical protein